jgi:redox-sensitive bicupin YhaK (pirin superfamily)
MTPAIENLIEARPRDLGGLHVGRVLPAVHRRTVGPFVFLDHMGPEEVGEIAVRPHPHIHLATVTYLFDGAIRHRDSLGSNEVIEPGAINWMNAGNGIVHSERSGDRMKMHGLQLWVALPKAEEDSRPSFDHYPSQILPTFAEDGAKVRVLAGSAHGLTSPVKTKSPLFYFDVLLEPGARVQLPAYAERAAYVIEGEVRVGSDRVIPRQMAVFGKGDGELVAEGPTRLVLLGGEPLDGPRYIWWNFVSSDPDRIVDAHHRWRDGKFPKVPGDEVEFIPAPADEPHIARDQAES